MPRYLRKAIWATSILFVLSPDVVWAQESSPGHVMRPQAWQVGLIEEPMSKTTASVVTGDESVERTNMPADRVPTAKPLPLPARSRKDSSSDGRISVPRSSWVSVIASLLVVCGLFLAFAWVLRRMMPQAHSVLPTQVVHILGRAPLSPRHVLHLLQVGNKLVLVSVGPTGIQTVTEVTEPTEVDRLRGLCHQLQPGSITASFRQILQQSDEGNDLQLGQPTGRKAHG